MRAGAPARRAGRTCADFASQFAAAEAGAFPDAEFEN